MEGGMWELDWEIVFAVSQSAWSQGAFTFFDFEPYQAKEAKQAQGALLREPSLSRVRIPFLMNMQCTLQPTGGGPAGTIAGSTAEPQQRWSSPQPASSPAEPSAQNRLRDVDCPPSREPPRRDNYYPPRESPPDKYYPTKESPPDTYYPPERNPHPTSIILLPGNSHQWVE